MEFNHDQSALCVGYSHHHHQSITDKESESSALSSSAELNISVDPFTGLFQLQSTDVIKTSNNVHTTTSHGRHSSKRDSVQYNKTNNKTTDGVLLYGIQSAINLFIKEINNIASEHMSAAYTVHHSLTQEIEHASDTIPNQL